MSKSFEYEIVNLSNPLKEDFFFKWDGETYSIKAGEVKQFPRLIAVHGAKHLAKRMIIKKGLFQDKVDGDKRMPTLVTPEDIANLEQEILDGKAAVEEVSQDNNEKVEGGKEEFTDIELTQEFLEKMNIMKLKKFASQFGTVDKKMKKPQVIELILSNKK